MEYEIDDRDMLFDSSTNPSLVQRPRRTPARNVPLSSWKRQKAVVIPEEEEQLS